MQVLKEEVKNAILREAKKEFLEHGYKNSSLRRISMNSGLSVGNLYRYFSGKNELFTHIVKPVVDQIKEISNHKIESVNSLQLDVIESIIDQYTDNIIKVFLLYKKEILIVLNHSEGSSFENIKPQIIEHFKEHIFEHLNVEEIKKDHERFKYIPEAYTVSVIEGLLSILVKNDSNEILQSNLKIYLSFIIQEFVKILEKMRKLV